MKIKPNKRAQSAIDQGREARREGRPITDNPYTNLPAKLTSLAAWWATGWMEIDTPRDDEFDDQIPF